MHSDRSRAWKGLLRARAWQAALATLAILVQPSLALSAEVLVICPDEFRVALDPWIEHRRQQGYELSIVPPGGTAEQVGAAIRQAAEPGDLRFVVLVGDAQPGPLPTAAERRLIVPTAIVPAKANLALGGEPDIATDNPYADLDGDQAPDIALGRLTADTPADLARIVQKILAYERASDFGQWHQRVHLVAGLGGFGRLIDAALETWTTRLVTDRVPPAYTTTVTYGSWTSPYCPDPRRFRATVLDRLSEGGLFWVYIGHGQPQELDQVRVPGDAFPILSTADADYVQCEHGPPIALFLACYTGAFDAPQDCLAEELLRARGGPVAVIAGSRVTMPYAMAVLGTELLQACFTERKATVGELLMAAKRNMLLRDRGDEESRALDTAATAFNQSADLAGERREHLALFNLIGDPLLRIPHPGLVALQAPATAMAGHVLEIAGDSEVGGVCSLELVVRRDRLRFKPPKRNAYLGTAGSLDEYQRVYDEANNPCLVAAEVAVEPGKFIARLNVPPDARGACHVRAFVRGLDACALGSVDIKIHRPPQSR
jgi:hypothetical protein